MSIQSYTAAGERLSNLDLTDHLARIDEAAAERSKIDSALERAMGEIGEIGRKLNDAKHGPHVDPDQAADALMAGGEIMIEVDTIERLEIERAGLLSGATRLRERESEAGRIESEAKNDATRALAACVADLAPILLADACHALEQLAAVYATAVALAEGAGSPEALAVADKLRLVMAEVQNARLLQGNQIPVPREMLDLLKEGRRPIEQLGRRWPERVAMPQRPISPALVVMGQENHRLRSEVTRLQG